MFFQTIESAKRAFAARAGSRKFLENEKKNGRKNYGAVFSRKVQGHMQKLSSFGQGKKFGLKSHLRGCCTKPFNYFSLKLFHITELNNQLGKRIVETGVVNLCGIFEPLYGCVLLLISSCFFDEIVNFFNEIVTLYQKWFCVIALLVFEKHFHFGSDISDYVMMLNSSLMKTSIQLSQDENKSS